MRKIQNIKRSGRLLFRTIVVSVCCSCVLFILLAGVYVLQVWAKKAVYISPLPQYSAKQANATTNINTLEKLLKEKSISYALVSPYDESSYLIHLSSGEEILFSSNKSLETQVSSLQLIISRLTIEGKRIIRLDFRFDKPVVTTR